LTVWPVGTGASCYHNCIDGGTSPEYFGYHLVVIIFGVEFVTAVSSIGCNVKSKPDRLIQRYWEGAEFENRCHESSRSAELSRGFLQ
jgi:hypothetical protein